MRAGPSSVYGGGSDSGAVFVRLRDVEQATPRHDRYFEVQLPWANQALATALAAITTGKRVLVRVRNADNPAETNAHGDPYCYRLYITDK